MIKVLHIFGIMNRGGAETRTMELMRHIDKTRVCFDYMSCGNSKGDYDEEIKSLGGIVYYSNIYSMYFFRNLYNIIKHNKYDVVQSHIHYVSGYIMLIAWLAGCKKRISHFRTASDEKNNASIKNTLLRHLVLVLSTHILAVNESTMESTIGKRWKSNKRCQILLNGVKSRYIPEFDAQGFKRYLGIDGKNVILHVGRIDHEKNHELLLKIFQKYHDDNKDSVLILVGRDNTSEAQNIRKYIEDNDLKSDVLIIGLSNDIDKYLNMAEIMVFPSLFEGLPGAILEALSVGLPVLASDIRAHQEIKKYIPDIELVKLDDKLEKWCEMIQKTIQSKNREEIRNEFDNAPFEITCSLKMLYQIYSFNKMGVET